MTAPCPRWCPTRSGKVYIAQQPRADVATGLEPSTGRGRSGVASWSEQLVDENLRPVRGGFAHKRFAVVDSIVHDRAD
jgi:hypothetical protein